MKKLSKMKLSMKTLCIMTLSITLTTIENEKHIFLKNFAQGRNAKRHHNTQHKDNPQNDTQHNDTQHNDTHSA
jgi:hypothetical protein